jgi:hypothetical protein
MQLLLECIHRVKPSTAKNKIDYKKTKGSRNFFRLMLFWSYFCHHARVALWGKEAISSGEVPPRECSNFS